MIGMDSLDPAFCMFVLPNPRSVLGSGVSVLFGCFPFVPFRRPSTLSAGPWSGKLGHDIKARNCGFFVSVYSFVMPTPSSAPSMGAARVICLLSLWHRNVCFVFFAV